MQISTATFHGTTHFGFDGPDGIYVALKPIVTAIGLDWSAQFRRVKRDPILAEGIAMMAIPVGLSTDEQEATCLRLDLLNGWLFGIDANRVKDVDKRAAVLTYQRECYRALAAHFAPIPKAAAIPAPATDAAAEPLHIRRSLVTEARQTHGTAAARELWFSLGLPTVPAMVAPGQPDLFGGRAHV